MRIPDAILTADIHATESQPVARTDPYLETQISKWRFISRIQQKYKCPIFNAGDLLDIWKSSPFLLGILLDYLPDGIITIPGQHEMPGHKLDRLEESGLCVLEKSGKIKVKEEGHSIVTTANGSKIHLWAYPWGIKPANPKSQKYPHPRVCMAHTLVYKGKRPFPGAPREGNAINLLEKLSDFDLIVTGDNHDPFVLKQDGRLLVNPGALLRTEADKIEHKPRIYLWYADTNTVKPIFIPIEQGVISRAHIDAKKEKDKRFEACIQRIENIQTTTIHFERNLEQYFNSNRERREVVEQTWAYVEG